MSLGQIQITEKSASSNTVTNKTKQKPGKHNFLTKSLNRASWKSSRIDKE